MDIRDALDYLLPGADWRNKPIVGDLAIDHAGIIWQDSRTMPTVAQCQQALIDLQAAINAAEQQKQTADTNVILSRANIQFLQSLIDADETKIRQFIKNNGAETTALRIIQILQFVLRWIKSRELRDKNLAD